MWIDVALDHFSARNQQPGLWIAVDVLRATSVMTTFLAEGGKTIYLTGDVEEARALRRQLTCSRWASRVRCRFQASISTTRH